MFDAKEARRRTQEVIRRRLEEKLEGEISKAVSNGESKICMMLSKDEIAILREAEYEVTAGQSLDMYWISW